MVGACFLVLAFVYSGVLQAMFVTAAFIGSVAGLPGSGGYTKAEMIGTLVALGLYVISSHRTILPAPARVLVPPYGVAMLRIALTYLAMSVIPTIRADGTRCTGSVCCLAFQPVTEQVSGVTARDIRAVGHQPGTARAHRPLCSCFDFKFVKKRT